MTQLEEIADKAGNIAAALTLADHWLAVHAVGNNPRFIRELIAAIRADAREIERLAKEDT